MLKDARIEVGVLDDGIMLSLSLSQLVSVTHTLMSPTVISHSPLRLLSLLSFSSPPPLLLLFILTSLPLPPSSSSSSSSSSSFYYSSS